MAAVVVRRECDFDFFFVFLSDKLINHVILYVNILLNTDTIIITTVNRL